MKILHITPNERTAQIIKKAANEKTEMSVLAFPVSLIYGHIPYRITKESVKLMTQDELKQRAILDFLAIPFNEYDRIIVWRSDDAESMLLLYYLCSLNMQLYYIDVTSACFLLHEVSKIPIGNMSERGIRYLMDTEIKLTSMYRRYASLCWWYHTQSRREGFRAHDRFGFIRNRRLDYYDNIILAFCSEKFMNVSYIIGLTIMEVGKSGNVIHDWFIFERLQIFAQEGLIETRHSPFNAKIKFAKSSLPGNAATLEIRKK